MRSWQDYSFVCLLGNLFIYLFIYMELFETEKNKCFITHDEELNHGNNTLKRVTVVLVIGLRRTETTLQMRQLRNE